MDHFRDLRERPDRARADARHKQKLAEILGRGVGCGGEIPGQTARDDVLGAHVVMRGHDEVGKGKLRLLRLGFCLAGVKLSRLPRHFLRAQIRENIELAGAR